MEKLNAVKLRKRPAKARYSALREIQNAPFGCLTGASSPPPQVTGNKSAKLWESFCPRKREHQESLKIEPAGNKNKPCGNFTNERDETSIYLEVRTPKRKPPVQDAC